MVKVILILLISFQCLQADLTILSSKDGDISLQEQDGSVKFKGRTLKDGKYKYNHYSSTNGKEELSVYAEFVIQNRRKEGDFRISYPSGKIQQKVKYKDGYPEGPYTSYHRNGKIESTVNFKNGQEEGPGLFYHTNGQIEIIRNYINGKLVGKVTHYYRDGSIAGEANYKNGQADGLVVKFHPNRYKEWEKYLKNGQQHGYEINYYEDGSIKNKKYYKNGVQQSFCYAATSSRGDYIYNVTKEFNNTEFQKRILTGCIERFGNCYMMPGEHVAKDKDECKNIASNYSDEHTEYYCAIARNSKRVASYSNSSKSEARRKAIQACEEVGDDCYIEKGFTFKASDPDACSDAADSVIREAERRNERIRKANARQREKNRQSQHNYIYQYTPPPPPPSMPYISPGFY